MQNRELRHDAIARAIPEPSQPNAEREEAIAQLAAIFGLSGADVSELRTIDPLIFEGAVWRLEGNALDYRHCMHDEPLFMQGWHEADDGLRAGRTLKLVKGDDE